ncbi:MAG: Uma2 family endonuclease [Oscillospiraceae bacterium]|nr:Uma2 family endonuclease [Oscillospiraceae bacterium]
MDIFMQMSTTARHNKMAGTFFGSILDLLRRKEAEAFQEKGALVYFGNKKEPHLIRLVDLAEIEDMDKFTSVIINDLYYVQPDFFIFQKNKYVVNERETRIAGFPDLIIEIWSDDNTKFDREVKFDLYSGSPVTEHWYIEQNSNEVECYFGKEKTKAQSLKNILKTKNGIEFDLRYLAL